MRQSESILPLASRDKIVEKIIARHILEKESTTYVSRDLAELVTRDIPDYFGDRFSEGSINDRWICLSALPTIIQNEITEFLLLNKIRAPEHSKKFKARDIEKSGSSPHFNLESSLRKWAVYIDYFKDIFCDCDLAMQKAKSVCVINNLYYKLDDDKYLRTSINYLNQNFPECELLRQDVKSFRIIIYTYKKVGILKSLIDSSL